MSEQADAFNSTVHIVGLKRRPHLSSLQLYESEAEKPDGNIYTGCTWKLCYLTFKSVMSVNLKKNKIADEIFI